MKQYALILFIVLGMGFMNAKSIETNTNLVDDTPVKIERVSLKVNMLKANLITTKLTHKTTLRDSIKLLKQLKKVIKEAEKEINI